MGEGKNNKDFVGSDIKTTTTEQTIMIAAEEEFLNNGFAGTKTVDIAKRAGVNHAMIHYYFRTKEALFNIVFNRKIEHLADSITASFGQDLPFIERVEAGISTHYDFVAKNPKVLFFIYNEVMSNQKRREALIKNLYPKLQIILSEMQQGIDQAVERGEIREMRAMELLMNVISLNVITFLTEPIFEMVDPQLFSTILEDRKRGNIEFVKAALKR